MKPNQFISIVLFAIAAAVLIWWFASGHHPWTTTQTMVEVKTTDELFGTTVTTQKWVDDFTPGFLPFSDMNTASHTSGTPNILYSIVGFLGIGPMAFLFIVAGCWPWFLAWRRARRSV
jgi:4-amino-4-deoxy-L-arabinose transferase-like glycosyltransferase